MKTRPRITAFICSWLLACLAAVTAHALPKTDTVTMFNGDRTTCEIKEMVRGKLKVKTVGMGTAYIEWDKIVRVDSHYAFLVKTREGLLAFGRLPDSGTDGELLVTFADHAVRFPLIDVVEIQPSRLELWDRLSLSVSLGFNYTKSTEITQIYLDANAVYRGQIFSWGCAPACSAAALWATRS
jgi:hypothetical protein